MRGPEDARGQARPVGVPAHHVPEEVEPVGEHIQLTVNGTARELDVEPRRLLVQALREDLDLTGTHVGCDTSQCGACTVHVDGHAVKSCTMLAVQADGAEHHDDRGPRPRRRPASAPERVLGEARPAVRVLHAGHDHDRGRPPGAQRGPHATTRSATPSRATSAAAPATRTSWRRSGPPRRPCATGPRPRSTRRQGRRP